jgi:hypothetical protein
MNRARSLVVIVLAGCVGCSSEIHPPTQPTLLSRVTIAQVNANRDAYVGQRIEVEGRIDVEPVTATLNLVVPGEARTLLNSLALYEIAPEGNYVPARCRSVTDATYDCGSLAKDAVTALQGSFVKIQQPHDTRLGPGPGQLYLVQDVYFLLVTR